VAAVVLLLGSQELAAACHLVVGDENFLVGSIQQTVAVVVDG